MPASFILEVNPASYKRHYTDLIPEICQLIYANLKTYTHKLGAFYIIVPNMGKLIHINERRPKSLNRLPGCRIENR